MYKWVLYQSWIIDFFISIGYPVGHPYKLYEDNQEIIKRALADIITPQSIPLDVLITAIHKIHLRNAFGTVDTISNTQLSDLNSKPHGGKSLQNIIDYSIGNRLYPPSRSLHYQILCLGQFHGPTHINCDQKNKSDIKEINIQCMQSHK